MLKKIIFILSGLFTLTILSIVIFSYYLLHTVSENTYTPLLYFPDLLLNAQNNPSLNSGFNFLILGLDPRDDTLEKTETTDTIILANLSKSWQVNLISIPRDLWSYPLNTKINQIYPQSLNQPNQYQYIQDNFSQITGQKIDRVIILTTQNLITLTNLIGGVDIYLENGFIDKLYPNPEYIKNPNPKTPIYKTVEFPAGLVRLNETNITEFVRSRKSTQTSATGGTDLGRIERQQLLINALVTKLKSPDFIKNPQNLFNMYNFWITQIATNFTDKDIASLVIQGYPYFSQTKITKIDIPAGDNKTKDIIYHPLKFINQQWVFIPQDKDYKSFHLFINNSLNDGN